MAFVQSNLYTVHILEVRLYFPLKSMPAPKNTMGKSCFINYSNTGTVFCWTETTIKEIIPLGITTAPSSHTHT